MSSNYLVKQGDHLSSIAKAFGFTDYKKIWDDPNNADLKALRVNPNVLYPGDVLYIPDKATTEYAKPTEKRHKFTKHGSKLKLCLKLADIYEKPIAGVACTLMIGTDSHKLTTDATGKLEQEIPPDASSGTLIIEEDDTPFQGVNIPIKIGNLDPVTEVSGQQARLNNLGYFPGPVGGTDTDAMQSAIEEFQCDQGLTVDGICGPQTQAKLKQVHGC
jgi:N-acetylmuramoyl-L-alanine amidase